MCHSRADEEGDSAWGAAALGRAKLLIGPGGMGGTDGETEHP